MQIIRRANEVAENPRELSGRFCQEFLNDMADLQCLLPTHQPRVTDHMEQIKDMIAKVLLFPSFSFLILSSNINSSLGCLCFHALPWTADVSIFNNSKLMHVLCLCLF